MNKSKILRTADEHFNNLPGFAYQPHYLEVKDEHYGNLRMHYIDQPAIIAHPNNQKAKKAPISESPVVLMLHGEPTWCYLYRKLIPIITQSGYRAIAPDHIGFGRSDKLPNREDYNYQKFVDWMVEFVEQLNLTNIVLVIQDWGGPIGLRTLANMSDRFSAVIVTNTLLPNCEDTPRGVANWPGELIENWVATTQKMDDLPVGDIVNGVCLTPLSAEIKAAYNAPFPEPSYKAAALEFPNLIPIKPSMAGCEENRLAWRILEQWKKPFITAFSDGDPSTKAWETIFQQRVPGAKNQAHYEIKQAGHFVQEEQGEELAQLVIKVLDSL
jgi:haloalkane dehalogenase